MISFIMAVYNHSEFLDATLSSLDLQSGVEFELICVDDCSTDPQVKNIISKWNTHPRFRFITNQSNLGLAKSLNVAFSQSKYDYIARIDADDICLPNRLEKQVTFLQANPDLDIVGCNAVLVNQNGDPLGRTELPVDHDSILKVLKVRNPMIHPSIVMKRDVMEKLGGYDETLRKAQDLDLWHRAAQFGFRFANMPECLIHYRVDSNKPIKTIFKGFRVSFNHAVRNRSWKGVAFSLIDLIKCFLIKFNFYTPRSIRNKM